MAWEIIIIRDSAEILAVLILFSTVFFTYRLMKRDEGTRWDYILIAICFLAISACLDLIGHYILNDMFSMLRRVAMLLSGIMFVGVFLTIRTQDRVRRKK